MGFTTTGVAMFLHVTAVVVGMALAGVLHLALIMIRRARQVEELRPWVPVIHRVEPLLPLAALVMLGTGAWLVGLSGGEVRWSQGWIIASLVGLIVAEGVGGAVATPHSKTLTAAITGAADGPVSPDLRERTMEPTLWYGGHFVTATFFGIILLMTVQPTGAWAPALVLTGFGVAGLASAVPFVRRRGHPLRIVHLRP